jgi:hypothetical protein
MTNVIVSNALSVVDPVHLTTAASLIWLSMSGCSVIITTGVFSDAVSSNGVQIIAAVTSAVTAHGAAFDTVTARLTNAGARTVFIPRCGSAPLLRAQQFVNGSWIDTANPACPIGGAANAIALDPGRTLVTVKVFAEPGRFRLMTTVGDSEEFSNSANSLSNAFAIP